MASKRIVECRGRRTGFTVAELVVVVGVAALLAVVLLPAVSRARDGARTVNCQATLFGLGQSMQIYGNDNLDGIPGVNTSGVAVEAKKYNWGSAPSVLSPRTLPVQTWDWMTPVLQANPNLPDGRAARFHYLYSEYKCPEQPYEATVYSGSMGPDLADFQQYAWPACSYLMSGWFQWFGQNDARPGGVPRIIGYCDPPDQVPIYAKAPPTNFEVRVDAYLPRLDRVGPPARKIFACDGTRYLDPYTSMIDIDVTPNPYFFGAFATIGAWWSGSTEYGVTLGSLNWCGQPVTPGVPGNGADLIVSYRHTRPFPPLEVATPTHLPRGAAAGEGVLPAGDSRPATGDGTAQNNRGFINAVFFDGHVARLNDQQSREIQFWYPTGAIVQTPAEGMTCATQGMVIP